MLIGCFAELLRVSVRPVLAKWRHIVLTEGTRYTTGLEIHKSGIYGIDLGCMV